NTSCFKLPGPDKIAFAERHRFFDVGCLDLLIALDGISAKPRKLRDMDAQKKPDRSVRLRNLLIDDNIDVAKHAHSPKLLNGRANGIARKLETLALINSALGDDSLLIASPVADGGNAENHVLLLRWHARRCARRLSIRKFLECEECNPNEYEREEKRTH